MLDPPWDVVSTRTSGRPLGSNKEPFRGEALRKAEGGVRVEDGEDHLCGEDNGGVGRRVASILISLAGVAGLFVLMGAYGHGPTGPTIIMESHICEYMDPQSRFGNFAIMGPFVCLAALARFLSRSPDLIIR
jgi:hypothetical protein